MPNVAPGNRSRTAWARTCAVEWRIVNSPRSESSVMIATWSPPNKRGLDQHPEEGGGFGDALAARSGVVDRRDRTRGVEVVVERGADVVEGAVAWAVGAPRVEATRRRLEQARRPVVLLAIGVAEDAEADGARIPLLEDRKSVV